MPDAISLALVVAVASPVAAALVVSAVLFLGSRAPGAPFVARTIGAGLLFSVWAQVVIGAAALGPAGATAGEIDFGSWLQVGSYEIPAVFLVDRVSFAFGALASTLTLLVARYSRTYLHKEPGFARFFLLLGLFASGTQLVAYAGAFDLMFAGWELMGVSSALFIGFYRERAEPARSSLRAFATYRMCDVGFLLAVVATHELIGSTRISAFANAAALPAGQVTAIAGLFMLAALGKSAQLPFSGWLPRAMEGPTPSSALFYGGVSIHAGLYLLLRIWPTLNAAPVVSWMGVVIGAFTALYATAIARTHPDAKGALAHATLAQVALILAEICLGLTTLALVHLSGHALLRVWQYFRAPNTLHDAHRLGHDPHAARRRMLPLPGNIAHRFDVRIYALALHRWRIDERIDSDLVPLWWLAGVLHRLDRRVVRWLSLDEEKR